MQSSLTQKPLRLFDDNLQAFFEGKCPCELSTLYRPQRDVDFNQWLIRVAGKIQDLLEELYLKYEILPAPVLLILATTKHRLMTPEPEPRYKEARQRRADMRKIDGALKVMATYDAAPVFLSTSGALPYQEDINRQNTAKSYLENLKREIGLIRPRKQPDVNMRFCAQALREFFRNVTGSRPKARQQTLDQYVGDLLVQAFNWQCKEGESLPKAAIQRAKGPRDPAVWGLLNDALALQHQKTGYWLEREKEIEREQNQTKKIREKLIRKAAPRRKAARKPT